MPSVFDLLAKIEKRTSMYVPGDGPERMLRYLVILLNGYACAVHLHGVAEPFESFNRAFSEYLKKRFESWSLACGPAEAILRASTSDEEAWDLYWKLVWEFKQSLDLA